MTRYEAFEAIAAVSDDVSWIEYRDRILAIIDQIDQPPGEFSVRELVESLEAGHWVQLYSDASWYMVRRRNHEGRGIDSLRAKLIELAKPPEPTTVMVEMPLAVARCCAELRDGDVAKACKAALEKAGVKL